MLNSYSLKQTLPYILIIGGAFGLLASFILTTEKIASLANTSYIPPCNLSPIISCGSVMGTAQASLFGFPNSLLGIAGFSIVITIGFCLIAGALYKKWFWIGLQAGLSIAILSAVWLAYQSIFIIGSLCAFCMIFWTATIALYSYTTVYNLQEKNLPLPKWAAPVSSFFEANPHLIAIGLFSIVIVTVLVKFWSYWITLV
jgi:uncharacterized membrane protein